METPAQNTKARGFVERSEIKVLGALSRIEVDRYLRGECGLPVSRREEDMLEDWATRSTSLRRLAQGLGRFLIKLGGLPESPSTWRCARSKKAGSTIRTSNGTPRRNPAMTDHLATGMKRMIRTVARSASLSDRLGERSRCCG